MVKTKEHKGLCSTCNNSNTCSHTKDQERPVLQCEEFDGYAPPKEHRAKSIEQRGLSTIRSEFIPPLAGLYAQGLCTNCEKRNTCTYPKPEGGVWHCEEYK